MYQWPVLNPVTVHIYHPKTDATTHSHRNRFETRATEFELLKVLEAQCHFFSKDALRRRQELGYIRSLGYIRLRKMDLSLLGIAPTEEEWVMYQLIFPDLGNRRYDVLEARPKCPLDGDWLYIDVHFEESKTTQSLEATETTYEKEPPLEQYTEIEVEDQ